MSTTSPFSGKDYQLNLSKRDISLMFREGNKLMDKCVNASTCPLGDMHNAFRKFEVFTEHLPHYMFVDYFERTLAELVDIAVCNHHKPVVRGYNGILYSASDMDDAMMRM